MGRLDVRRKPYKQIKLLYAQSYILRHELRAITHVDEINGKRKCKYYNSAAIPLQTAFYYGLHTTTG